MREPCIPERDSGWFTSSYSGPGNTECVEVALRTGMTAVRDSKDKGGPVLGFSVRAWGDFVGAVRRDQLS
ncbi:DUF397 domain-containing protein [Streptomyces cucumeris]|uniref:DUF397 domain-containing protein n=1 Tax=Streptomyces cucumeris TaxID=2962890 RepID=UPI003D718AA2